MEGRRSFTGAWEAANRGPGPDQEKLDRALVAGLLLDTMLDEPGAPGDAVSQPLAVKARLQRSLVTHLAGRVTLDHFRTLVRNVLHRPGATMRVYTKIATVFWQDLEAGWGQFDGGIHGLHRRSSGAAFAAGATVQNMNLPEIADNIRWASDYLKDLKGPRWEDVFPDRPVDAAKANLGKSVYLAHCNRCHGHPEGRAEALRWVKGELQGELTPLDQIRTDPERVTFRYYEELPDVLAGLFPKGHEFDFPRDELRPRPGDPTRGYLNKPLHSVFSRGPYLHNASVLTLKELIHLEDRRPVFFRGANPYDIEALGLWSPREGDPKAGTPPFYFRFDTRAAGNSNRGHDYPWRRQDVQQDTKKQADLENLLEYLKTL